MSSKEFYHQNKAEVFAECGLRPHEKGYNCHHIINRSDVDRKKVSRTFPLDDKENLIPLLESTHELLHKIDSLYFHKDITTRVYLANMAFIGELDLVPDRFYRCLPETRKRRH